MNHSFIHSRHSFIHAFVRARASCGRWCVGLLGRITRYWWYRRGEETRMPHHTQQKKQQSGWGILMLSAYRMAAWADAELVQKAKQHGLDTDFSTECVFGSVLSPRAPSVGRDVSFTWKYRTNSGKEIPAVSCRSASIRRKMFCMCSDIRSTSDGDAFFVVFELSLIHI